MVIILIRRCVRPEKEKEFLANFKHPVHSGYIGETLTKVRDPKNLPEPMRSFNVQGENCVTYINVARWKNVECFMECFPPHTPHDIELETEARVRVVLNVVLDDV